MEKAPFFCTLKDMGRLRMENGLRELMSQKEDQILIVDLGANEEAAREVSTFMETGIPEPESGMVVI